MFIDTHVHLNSERYDDLDGVIENAKRNDVGIMIVSGYNKSSSIKAIEIANTYNGVYASVGLHPSDCKDETDLELNWLKQLVNEKKVVAVGEIGLDYYWDKSFMDLQKNMFLKQIEIARNFNLPIVVHSRDASLDTWEILSKNQIDGVLHCYSGSLEMAKSYVKLGYYLGVSGVITFQNSKTSKKVVEEIDLKHLVSETDAPYLTPHPFRGKINYPEYVGFVVEKIAEIKNVSICEVKKAIRQNVKKLFRIGEL